MNLAEKVVVITGGSAGFGRGLAEAFTLAGAVVVITSDKERELKRAAQAIGCDYYAADASRLEDCATLVNCVLKKHGTIDVWVNNAGIQIAPSLLEEVNINKLHKLIDINFFGYFYGCKTVLPHMKQQNDGVIININSTAGLSGKPNLSAYVSSKFAIKGMTEALRVELINTGVSVLQVFPGGMQTDIYHEKVPEDFGDYMDIGYAIDKVMTNLQASEPEADLIIRRPGS